MKILAKKSMKINKKIFCTIIIKNTLSLTIFTYEIFKFELLKKIIICNNLF